MKNGRAKKYGPPIDGLLTIRKEITGHRLVHERE